jgi:hypothetical protein
VPDEVDTAKSLTVPAGGLVTPTMKRVKESPLSTARDNGILAEPLASTLPVATRCQDFVVSVTSIPVTVGKPVWPAGSEREMSPPAGMASDTLKLTK